MVAAIDPNSLYSLQVRIENGFPPTVVKKGTNRICHRRTGSSNGIVATIINNKVTIYQPAYLDHLHSSDMLAILQAIAPDYTSYEV